jgi:arylsulfatase A-like enzyme
VTARLSFRKRRSKVTAPRLRQGGSKVPAACGPGLCLLLAALSGCGGDPPAPPAIEAQPPIRLIDHLDRAEATSPLFSAPTLEQLLGDLEQLGAARLWSTGFGSGETYRQRGCRPLDAGGIECGGAGGNFSLSLKVPVAAAAPTALVLDLQADDPGCVMVEIWDRAERIRQPLPADTADGSRLPILWPHRPQTAEISLRIARRRLPGSCRLTVRSVTAHALEAGAELGLALLQGRHAGPGGGATGAETLAGFGSYLPLADAETVRPPFDENFSTREVLLAPAPTEIRFRLRVPAGARLDVSYALSRESRPGDRVDFEVRAGTKDGDERALWSQRLELTAESWHWHEATVALERFGGRTIELIFSTRSPAGGGLALWGTPTVHVPRQPGEPPNVILIAVDTLRADRLSAYGYDQPTSPRIDALADDGVLFLDAVSQSNWTVPSFASIFTGKIVPRHGLATFANRLAPGAVTLPGLFRDGGWRTHAVLYKAALYQRLDRGFETTFNVPLQEHRADRNLGTALEWLHRRRDERFFLYLHFDDPHQPFSQPEEFRPASAIAALRSLGLEMPLNLWQELPHCADCVADGSATAVVRSLANRLYDEEIRYVDDRIGRFIDELRRLGLYEDALIAFVSDHGETLWSHYDYPRHGSANLHDELIRVPLIVKPPAGGQFRSAAVVASRVAAFDLMPTLLELAGIDRPPQLDARSLVPLLRADAGVQPAADRIAFSQGSSSAALLYERWKYVMPVGRGVPPGQEDLPSLEGEALYDLRADPGERRDLAAAEPARLRELRERAIEYVVGTVGGRFLLVAGESGGAERRLEVACDAPCAWHPLLQFGLERVATDATGLSAFEGRGLGEGVLLLAGVQGAPSGEMRVRSGTAGSEEPGRVAQPVAFEPGVVARLLRHQGVDRQQGGGAWLLSAPERGAGPLEASALDPQQEEALRALGYLQ